MKTKEIADTGCRVSTIGLGTVKFGRNADVKYPSDFTIPDDAELRNLLSIAKEGGINLIDTAPAYGASERRLGSLLKGQRQDWILSTKAGEHYADGVSRFDFSAPGIERSIYTSLKTWPLTTWTL